MNKHLSGVQEATTECQVYQLNKKIMVLLLTIQTGKESITSISITANSNRHKEEVTEKLDSFHTVPLQSDSL